MTHVTSEACNERHRPNRMLWGAAMVLLGMAGTAMGAALTFALDARTEVRQVEAESSKHQAVSAQKWDDLERTLQRIERDVRAIRNGHAGGPAIATESEG